MCGGVTTEARQDVVLLAQWLAQEGGGGGVCFRELVVGQLLDQRVGYWSGDGLAFTPRAVPFIEDVPIAVRSLLAGLRWGSALSAASLHPSLAAGAVGAGGGRAAAHLTLLSRVVCPATWASLGAATTV